jgi:hypothetical protein
MNANELADELDIHVSMGGSKFFKEAATMLRQQQAEIEALKAHPVKKLTDEEKWEVFTNLARSPDLRADMIRFADSILKKAQEK